MVVSLTAVPFNVQSELKLFIFSQKGQKQEAQPPASQAPLPYDDDDVPY